MASARSMTGLRTSEVPDLRKGFIGKGRGRGIKGRNINDSTDSVGAPNAADQRRNGGIPTTEPEVEQNEHASKSSTSSREEVSIIALINKMCTGQDAKFYKELSPESEQLILEKVFESVTTSEQLEALTSSLYEWTLLDPSTTLCVAGLCATLAKFEKDGCTFRSVLLNKIKNDFQSRDQWRTVEPTKWLSFVCLLCDLFAQMKTNSNAHMIILVEPVYSCMEQSLVGKNTSDKVIAHASVKLCQLGAVLQRHDPAKMDLLVEGLRSKLLAPESTAMGRLKCLGLIELCASGWEFDKCISQSYTELQQKMEGI